MAFKFFDSLTLSIKTKFIKNNFCEKRVNVTCGRDLNFLITKFCDLVEINENQKKLRP